MSEKVGKVLFKATVFPVCTGRDFIWSRNGQRNCVGFMVYHLFNAYLRNFGQITQPLKSGFCDFKKKKKSENNISKIATHIVLSTWKIPKLIYFLFILTYNLCLLIFGTCLAKTMLIYEANYTDGKTTVMNVKHQSLNPRSLTQCLQHCLNDKIQGSLNQDPQETLLQ